MIKIMMRNLTSYKRQIEILTMFYPEHLFKNCRIEDLSDKYNVSVPTVNRDLQDLRSMSIPIYSEYGKGIRIDGNVKSEAVAGLIIKYIALYYSDVTLQNALFKAVENDNLTFVYIFRTLNEAIDKQQKVLVEFSKNRLTKITEKFLPCKILFDNNDLEFIGIFNNNAEVIKFRNINSIKLIDEFDKNKYDKIVDNIVNNKTDNITVKLKLQFEIKGFMNISRYKISQLNIISVNNNKVDAESKQNNLDDLAEWAIRHHKTIKVLEPKELRDRVLEIAESTIENYLPQSEIKKDIYKYDRETDRQFFEKDKNVVNKGKEKPINLEDELKESEIRFMRAERALNDKVKESEPKYMMADMVSQKYFELDLNFESSYSSDKNISTFKKIFNKIMGC